MPLSNEQGRRVELQRFGYSTGKREPAEVWLELRCDFPSPINDLVLTDIPACASELAERYCNARAHMDTLLDRCDEIHLAVLRTGPDAALVETYAAARDAYEDSVERFGEMRVELQAAVARQ